MGRTWPGFKRSCTGSYFGCVGFVGLTFQVFYQTLVVWMSVQKTKSLLVNKSRSHFQTDVNQKPVVLGNVCLFIWAFVTAISELSVINQCVTHMEVFAQFCPQRTEVNSRGGTLSLQSSLITGLLSYLGRLSVL